MSEAQVFFVHLENAHQMRRSLLGAAKGVLSSLRKAESVRAIRAEKLECILQLKKKLDELQTLGRKLRNILPKTNMKPELPRIREMPKAAEMPQVPRKNKLEMLEEELAKVERTLTEIE